MKMNNKGIIFVEANNAQLLETPLEAPKDNQVQVRLMRSAISSGTERANLIGDKSLSPNNAPAEARYPRQMGYSSAGIVSAVGNNVQGYKEGDRVALTWSKHSLYQNMGVENVHKLPDDIDFCDAAFFHIACFPLAAIRKCHLEIGESALVMGLGVLGMFAVTLLRAAGAVPVIAADPSPEKREKALLYGADYALDPLAPDFAQTVQNITGGGANVAIEVTGIGAGLNGALDCMAKMGRVALLGCTRNSDFTVDYYRKVHGKGVSLIGAHTMARPALDSSSGLWTLRDDMKTLIKLTKCGRISLRSMMDELRKPEEAHEVYNRLANEKVFPLVQFDWSELK